MGCGCSIIEKDDYTYSKLEIEILEIKPVSNKDDNHQYKISKISTEFISLERKKTFFDHITDKSTKTKKVLEFFSKNFRTKREINPSLLNKAIYLIYYDTNIFPKICEINKIKNLIPFEENFMNKNNPLKKVIILLTGKINFDKLYNINLFKSIEELLKTGKKGEELQRKTLFINDIEKSYDDVELDREITKKIIKECNIILILIF